MFGFTLNKEKKALNEKINKQIDKRIGNDNSFASFPDLMKIKPRQGYMFKSDYFMIDNQYATILSLFHPKSANDAFRPFWGVALIPSGLDVSVEVTLLQQTKRMSDGWVASHKKITEKVLTGNDAELSSVTSRDDKLKRSRVNDDFDEISVEIANGASYLNVHFRLLVKAPTLDMLDSSVDIIERQYKDAFATISAKPFTGELRDELTNIFLPQNMKRGKGFYFTSVELAGAYNLVTHGIEDPAGEYVGEMIGDVNCSAVLFDVDGYKKRVVIASENEPFVLDTKFDCKSSALWCSKLSGSALINNRRVVHLILDGTDLDEIGCSFKDITYRINMDSSDVNMFEVFGEKHEELALFSAQLEKLKLMITLVSGLTSEDKTLVLGKLADIVTDFYIDKKMWSLNAMEHKDRLRLVGIKDHKELPRLFEFSAWLNAKYDEIKSRNARDPEELHAFSILATCVKEMLQANGDLFNCFTNDTIDGIKHAKRGIYDFSKLFIRGEGVAMAQFVNIIAFAVGNLGENDTLIIHGAEKITSDVESYVNKQFMKFFDKGGRIVYAYNKIDDCFNKKQFNEFDKADYTIFGNFTNSQLNLYKQSSEYVLPPDLEKLLVARNDRNYFLHRGFDNVVFENHLYFGISSWAR